MDPVIRKVQTKDSAQLSHLIRTVMPEFGANGPGFAIHDAEVEDIFKAYTQPRCVYFVCEEDGKILGGGGIAPLQGGEPSVCELKKMYFYSHARGKGLGQKVLTTCLDAAKELGFGICYLETFNTMRTAMQLYEKNGFKKIPGPLGNTGHFACDTFYKKVLS